MSTPTTSAMPQVEITVADVLRSRAATYNLLSRLYRSEVDEELLAQMKQMSFSVNTGNAELDRGNRMMRRYLALADSGTLTELAIDYVKTFIGSSSDTYCAAYPYESVYTSPKRLMMQEARDEVLALYRAAGLDKADDWAEAEDHIALELEYLATLAQRAWQAAEAGDDEGALKQLLAQRNFLEDHLCAWFPMMAEDMRKFATTGFYQAVCAMTSGWLEIDGELVADILESSE